MLILWGEAALQPPLLGQMIILHLSEKRHPLLDCHTCKKHAN
jgi:hypothetical protein